MLPPVKKKTRSPGLAWLRLIRVVAPYCAAAVRGRGTPSMPEAYCVSPEQSNPRGDEPPYTYGTPRYREAMATTQPPFARPEEAGAVDVLRLGAALRDTLVLACRRTVGVVAFT